MLPPSLHSARSQGGVDVRLRSAGWQRAPEPRSGLLRDDYEWGRTRRFDAGRAGVAPERRAVVPRLLGQPLRGAGRRGAPDAAERDGGAFVFALCVCGSGRSAMRSPSSATGRSGGGTTTARAPAPWVLRVRRCAFRMGPRPACSPELAPLPFRRGHRRHLRLLLLQPLLAAGHRNPARRAAPKGPQERRSYSRDVGHEEETGEFCVDLALAFAGGGRRPCACTRGG